MSDLIGIKTFLHRHEAELIKGLLDNEGIKSIISSDDCGAMRPGMSFGASIQLLIHKADVERVRIILDSLEKNESEQPLKNEQIMKCPQCSKEMEEGTAEIHGRWHTFLLFGFSHQNLYFRNADYKEEKVLGSDTPKEAFFCNNCKKISL